MRVIMLNAERLLDGSKTALLIPALPTDRYRLAKDAPWRRRDDGFMHDQRVHAMRQPATRLAAAEGDILDVRSLETRQVLQVQLTDLRMADCARLTNTDIFDLGYTRRLDYDIEIGHLMRGRTAWLARFIPLLPTARAVQ